MLDRGGTYTGGTPGGKSSHRPDWTGPFWTMVGIRGAFWVGTALTLAWQPFRSEPFQPFPRAYGSWGDALFGVFYQWDSTWFAQIAQHGYGARPLGTPPGTPAFFPLYPLLVHAVAWVTRSTAVAGVLLSLAAAGVAAALLRELARPLLGERAASDAVLLVALYPLAFVFTAVYSDALFLLLVVGSFLPASRGRPWPPGAWGFAAVGTRSLGLALVPALLVLLWPRPRSPHETARLGALVLVPLGLVAYAIYLHVELGDAWAFVHAQEHVWSRSTPTLGPLSGLWQALDAGGHGLVNLVRHLGRQNNHGAGFPQATQIGFLNLVHLAALVPALGLTWVAWRRLGAAYGLYSLATIVFVLSTPNRDFPLFSFLRFLLGDFPIFLALAALLAERPRARLVVLCSFSALGAAAAIQFSRHGYVA